jgi:hypothetical protein
MIDQRMLVLPDLHGAKLADLRMGRFANKFFYPSAFLYYSFTDTCGWAEFFYHTGFSENGHIKVQCSLRSFALFVLDPTLERGSAKNLVPYLVFSSVANGLVFSLYKNKDVSDEPVELSRINCVLYPPPSPM